MSDPSHLYRSAMGIKHEPPNPCGVAMLILLIVAVVFLCSCSYREWQDVKQEINPAAVAMPDSFMIGQGVGEGSGTYLYVSWAIPQPQ